MTEHVQPVRVLVVGSINADDAIRVSRLPGPGETVSAQSARTSLGGKGANQAVAAARAGGLVEMVGAVGADDLGLVSFLDAEGIGTETIARLHGTSAGRAIVLIDDHAENSIVVVPGANDEVPHVAVEHATASLRPGDVLLLQHEIPIAITREAARRARDAGASVVWNAAPAPTSPDDLITDLDLLVVNEHELAAIATLLDNDNEATGSHSNSGHSVTSLIADVSRALHTDVVCTLGANGASYLVAGESGHASARRVDPVDTTAAGDTFVGYLAATAGLPFPDRLRGALSAATLTVTRPGAATSIPSMAEVRTTLNPERSAV